MKPITKSKDMSNADKIILDLCGGTGAWSRPYRDAGYDVRLITLPEYDVHAMQINEDHMFFPQKKDLYPYDGSGMIIPYSGVYGILAAPPCTEFSLAKNGSHRSRNLSEGMETVEACLRIIWTIRLHSRLQFWAMENPVGYLRQFLGRPPYTFYQWWFGDTGIKRTDLWGYFREPRQLIFDRPDDPYFVKQYKSGKKNQFAWAAPKPPEWLDATKLDRAALRAITPAGFAQAFYKANR